MNYLSMFAETLITTVRDILPIAFIIAFFQLFVLRRPLNNVVRLLWGFGFVVLGLAMFLMGLELALFPLGEEMANQLTASVGENQAKPWYSYYWTYLFAFAIGFSATIAEPALLAVAIKAHEASGGTIQIWILRAAVAVGCGTGVALGTLRIITGIPLPYFVLAGYLIVIVQTDSCAEKNYPAGLRFRRCDDIDNYRTAGDCIRIGIGREHTGPQSSDRGLWYDCAGSLVSNDHRHGVCAISNVVSVSKGTNQNEFIE